MSTATATHHPHLNKTRVVIPLGQLVDAPYNPPQRITERAIANLEDSMNAYGQLQPILVTVGKKGKHTIIDGHRRVASARKLGWDDIEADILDADADAVYASINVSGRKMGGNEALTVWLKAPQAVSWKLDKEFQNMEKDIGRPLLVALCKQGMSYKVYRVGKRIAHYCDDPNLVKAFCERALKFQDSGKIGKALQSMASPNVLRKAVYSKRAVKFSLEV